MILQERLNSLTEIIIGAALDIHQALGPGMLESAYEACLTFELLERGLAVDRQKPMPLVYRGRRMDIGYRLDLMVDGQLLSYLRCSGCKVGLRFNFNTYQRIRGGLKRVVNGFPE